MDWPGDYRSEWSKWDKDKYHVVSLICVCVCSVMSDSLWPYKLQSTSLLCLCDFQAQIVEWIVISSSRGYSLPKDWNHSPVSPALAGRLFTSEPPGKPKNKKQMNLFTKQKQNYRHRHQAYGYQRRRWDKLGVWNQKKNFPISLPHKRLHTFV